MITMLALLFSIPSFAAMPAKTPAPAPAELLTTSDRARGAAQKLEGLSWTSEVESEEGGNHTKIIYGVKILRTDALAEVKDPPRQKGEVVLFNDRTLWFFKPGLKKPVNISPRQKLIGQAANGDIASTQYARDYEATSAGEDKVQGKDCWKLELKAKAKNVTYDRIRYWVSKKDQVAVKAEFLTLSGEPFKSAEFQYNNSIKIGGGTYPFVSKMTIRDAVNASNVTTINYKDPREETHSSAIFNVNRLMR
ncbi:MAG TPA: outer membrane lipoprotein-sorting protein [Bdellovibrionota bacterium]|jgi:outer membrane lipoprotein-sorting protein